MVVADMICLILVTRSCMGSFVAPLYQIESPGEYSCPDKNGLICYEFIWIKINHLPRNASVFPLMKNKLFTKRNSIYASQWKRNTHIF
jgi:hypothetical protein